jgi:hypothetical protein
MITCHLSRTSKVMLIAAAAALVPASVVAKTIGSESSSGDYATVVASGSVENPSTIRVRVTASPKQRITGNWTLVCSRGTGAGSKSGKFSGRTTIVRRMRLPMGNPDSCTASAGASLDRGGRIRVTLLSP